jgi:dihydrolipoamide dehydrogenase
MSSQQPHFDAAIVGAGAGGLTVALGLSRIGRKVALIEADAIGGDCTNVGCIPSKTLLHLSQQLAQRGLEGAAFRAAAMLALSEVRHIRDELRLHETEMLEAQANLTLIRGRARLVDRRTLDVEGVQGSELLHARRIVLATGAKPRLVPIAGLEPERILSHVTLFDIDAPPEHLLVMGGGPIGVEMATAFARLGSRVSVVDVAEQLLPGSEPEAAAVVQRSLEALGARVMLGVTVVRFEGDTAVLSSGEQLGGVTRVLQALGRTPAVDDLCVRGSLADLGIKLRPGGIVTGANHQTGARGVYAIGEVTERAKFTHAANAQGRRLVRHLMLPLLPLTREGDYPSATFTTPEVAQIGPTLAELKQRLHPELIVSQRVALRDLDRALTSGVQEGFVLLHARRLSGRLLSATVVAPQASEMVQLLTWAQRRRISLWQLSRHIVAYPALSEAIKRAADGFVFATLAGLPGELIAALRPRLSPGKLSRFRRR